MPTLYFKIICHNLSRISIAVCLAIMGIIATIAPCAASSSKPLEYTVFFPINSSRIRTDFGDNKQVISALIKHFRDATRDSIKVGKIAIHSLASPDGRTAFNRKLIRDRHQALARLLSDSCAIPMQQIIFKESEIPVQGVILLIKEQKPSYCDTVIPILQQIDTNNPGSIEKGMRTIKSLGGTIWKQISTDILPQFRYASVALPTPLKLLGTQLSLTPPASLFTSPVITPPDTLSHGVCSTFGTSVTTAVSHTPSLALGTNLFEAAFAIANLHADYRWTPHFSSSLSLHYSCWNYGTETRKFRLAAIATEFRWWLKPSGMGLFSAINLGTGIYNVVWDNIRWQDPKGGLPALGAGAKIGYRLPLFNSPRWVLDLSAGAAIYRIRYDEFRNVHNGPQFSRGASTIVIPNGIGVVISYLIPLGN